MCALHVCIECMCSWYDVMASSDHLDWNVFPFTLVILFSVGYSWCSSELLHISHDMSYLIDIGTKRSIIDKVTHKI